MNDDLDLDSVLFGGSDPPADGSFDPFLPGLGQEGAAASPSVRDTDGHDGDGYEEAVDDDGIGIIRYGRFGDQSDSEHERDSDQSLPWQGARDQPVAGAGERHDRERADAGIRNVRRTAEEHSGRSTAGGTRANSPRVDSSISAAAERIRADLRVPLDARERSAAVLKWEQARAAPGGGKIRRYEKQGVTDAPQFMSTDFEAMLVGLKAGRGGDWILTLQVSRDARQAVYSMDDAFGLALDIHVQRRKMTPDDEGS